MHALVDFWSRLPAGWQDIALFAALIAPALVLGVVVVRGYAPFALVRAMLWRFRWTNVLFVLLIAVSVGLGVGLIAQERGLRQGTARAAEKFDLIVGAPGSEMTLMLAAVYLQPSDMPLVGGAVYHEIEADPRVSIAAPIAFGDSVAGAPVVGTTPQFVTYLAGRIDGRVFAAEREAVAGAYAPVAIGDTFEPAHGLVPIDPPQSPAAASDHEDEDEHEEHGHDDEAHAAEEEDADEEGHVHEGEKFTVVGRMAPTGSPWDRAVLVPVEAVWEVHGLANGHGLDWDGTVGPPFEPSLFPGTPAVLVRAEELWANYALRSEFTRDDVMAIFPGAVLAQLHAILGDVRQAMSLLAIITQVLVTASVLIGLVILSRLYAQRLALLRALGAPARFTVAVLWGYGAALIAAGALLGAAIGYGAAVGISRIVTAETDILVTAQLGWPELHLIAAFVSLTSVLAILPAVAALRRPIVGDLRA